MRLFSSVLAMLSALVLVLTACGSSENAAHTEDGKTVVRYQGWAGEVRFQELAEDLGYYQKIKLDWVGNTTSGPQDIQSVATGDIEVGEAFNGAVVKLNAAGAPITSVLSSYGADEGEYTGYFVLDNSPVHSARDLIGKKVGMNTLGAHHEFLTREWLAKEGLTNDEIKTVTLTVVPPVNTEQALREHQIDVAALNGIWRETAEQRGGIRPLFTDKSLFGAFSYGTFVVRDDFLAKNRDAGGRFRPGHRAGHPLDSGDPARRGGGQVPRDHQQAQTQRGHPVHRILAQLRHSGGRRGDRRTRTADLDRLAGAQRRAQGRAAEGEGPLHQRPQPVCQRNLSRRQWA